MRRLPIFLAIDVSESMAGSPMQNVNRGIADLAAALSNDPMAIETAYLSVIAFAGKTKVVTPLTSLLDFVPPSLSIGAGTSLSAMLSVLTSEIDHNVHKNTPESKGDWRPIVFVLTDGSPTDAYDAAIAAWKKKFGGKVSVIAIHMGTDSDSRALKQLTDSVIVFKNASKESYKEFFKWVSSSVQTCSKEIGEKGIQQDFEKRISENLQKDMIEEKLPCENQTEYLAIPSRCLTSKQPYILRAVKHHGDRKYQFDGAYKIDESYFDLSEKMQKKDKISTNSLEGEQPACPYCGNRRYAVAACGKCHCFPQYDTRDRITCPWCGESGIYTSGGNLRIAGGRD